MKKYILLYCIAIITSCTNNAHFSGRYFSCHENSNSLHYVDLFSDSTFLHVYRTKNMTYEHKGIWNIHYSKNQRQYFIDFNEWKDFDSFSMEYKKKHFSNPDSPIHYQWLIIRNNQIFFDIDNYDLNFKRRIRFPRNRASQ